MQDYLLDTDGDLKIVAHAVVMGESSEQHQQLLLIVDKGGIKENPTSTLGAMAYLEGENRTDILQDIRKIFTADGMIVKTLQFNAEGKLQIDASYKS